MENINNNNYNAKPTNNINDNILSELKNDNILSVKKNNFHIVKPHKKKSFPSDSIPEDINNNYNNDNDNDNNSNYFEPNIKKYSIVSRNKKKNNKIKYKFKSQEENNNFDNYTKINNFHRKKVSKRRSFDIEKKDDLQRFQKLLKININDVDAKLNNINNVSSSFEILNENQEIYDRFIDSNIIIKDNLENYNNNYINENFNAINNNNNFSKINILSSPLKNLNKNSSDKNINEEYLITKNIIAAKTSSDFYSIEPSKRLKNESALKPIKNKKNTQMNKKISDNNSNLVKKTNSDLFNLQSDIKNKTQNEFRNSKNTFFGPNGDQMYKQSEDSINKYHNYFIGFQFGGGLDDNKKIKKQKKIKNNKYYQMMINEEKKINNHKNAKK